MRVHLAGGPGAPVAHAADDITRVITRANRFRHARTDRQWHFGDTVRVGIFTLKSREIYTINRVVETKRRSKENKTTSVHSGGKNPIQSFPARDFPQYGEYSGPNGRYYRLAVKVSLSQVAIRWHLELVPRKQWTKVVFSQRLRNADVYFIKSIVLLLSV